jgi:FkbM family methyltransferase
MKLTFKQKTSFFNHLFKALTRSHHSNLQALLSPMIADNGVVLDVGGHAGQFTKLFSKMVPEGQVFTFEPSVYSRSILQVMAGLKYLQNVYVLPFGLADKPGHAEIHTPVKKKGSFGYGLAFVGSKDDYQREVVSSQIVLSSIDQVVKALAISRVDFIKADIEGGELSLLLGAEETLKMHKPALLLEIDDFALARNHHSGKQLVNYLYDLGYNNIQQIDIDNAKIISQVDFSQEKFNGDYLFRQVD